jgi:hypothetical protein
MNYTGHGLHGAGMVFDAMEKLSRLGMNLDEIVSIEFRRSRMPITGHPSDVAMIVDIYLDGRTETNDYWANHPKAVEGTHMNRMEVKVDDTRFHIYAHRNP